MGVPQKLEICVPYDLTIPLLGIYPNEMKSGSLRDMWMLMFIAKMGKVSKKAPSSMSHKPKGSKMWNQWPHKSIYSALGPVLSFIIIFAASSICIGLIILQV